MEKFYWCLRLCPYVLQSCLTFCRPMDCSPPGSSVHGILQARILEWVAMPSCKRSSRSRDQTLVSCIGRWVLYCWRPLGSAWSPDLRPVKSEPLLAGKEGASSGGNQLWQSTLQVTSHQDQLHNLQDPMGGKPCRTPYSKVVKNFRVAGAEH